MLLIVWVGASCRAELWETMKFCGGLIAPGKEPKQVSDGRARFAQRRPLRPEGPRVNGGGRSFSVWPSP